MFLDLGIKCLLFRSVLSFKNPFFCLLTYQKPVWVLAFFEFLVFNCQIQSNVFVVNGADKLCSIPGIFFICITFVLQDYRVMGRGRGKGKKLSTSNHDDPGSGEEEKIPVQKRRGRPQKPLKDDIEEEEVEKIEDEDVENGTAAIMSKGTKFPTAENGKKRKRLMQPKEKPDSVKEENGAGTRSSTDDSAKSNGFRQNGSRRKSKPRRAAEAVVECK